MVTPRLRPPSARDVFAAKCRVGAVETACVVSNGLCASTASGRDTSGASMRPWTPSTRCRWRRAIVRFDGHRVAALGREATLDLRTCLPDSGHTGKPRAAADGHCGRAGSDGVATPGLVFRRWRALPSPVFDRFLGLWSASPARSAAFQSELRRFWNADRPPTRLNARSEHRPVTPGVAGSSPVHSAKNSC